MNKYEKWIRENYPDAASARMQCQTAVEKMKAAFPELRIVRGYAMVSVDFRPHWWMKDEAGNIIDPTAHQWGKILFYEEIDEDEEQPHGKCHNCGEYLYRARGDEQNFCLSCLKTCPAGNFIDPMAHQCGGPTAGRRNDKL